MQDKFLPNIIRHNSMYLCNRLFLVTLVDQLSQFKLLSFLPASTYELVHTVVLVLKLIFAAFVHVQTD